jgi:hypothetical protein
MLLKLFALIFMIIALTSCAHVPGGIAESTEPLNNRTYEELGKTEASDSRVSLFGIIPISNSNSIQKAVDLAKEKIGADALIKVTVESYSQWWLLFTNDAIVVRGVGIKFK